MTSYPDPVSRLLDTEPDALRAVVATDADGVDPLYIREDVRRDADADRLDRTAGLLASLVDDANDAEATAESPFGPRRARIRLYESVAVVLLPADDGAVVVTVDAPTDSTERVLASLVGDDG